MALGFLGDIAGGMGQVAPLVGGIGSLLDVFGFKKPKQNYGPSPAEQQAMSLLMALAEPKNSLVEQRTQENLQSGVNDFLMQLKQMQMMDARRGARGQRGTFFNPERADETVDYLTSRGMPKLVADARNKARSDIAATASGLQGFAVPQQARIDQQNKDRLAGYERFNLGGGFAGMSGKVMGGLQDLLGAMTPNPNNYDPNFVGAYKPFPWQVG
jgi:hypothetical protein